jgi:putative membrane protein
MIIDALVSYAHFAAVFLLFAFLTVEAMLLRYEVDSKTATLIARVDLWYGASAVLVLVTGLLRLFLGAKGQAFYLENPVFWMKVALFAVVGMLSISPTLMFLRWSRAMKTNPGFTPEDAERRKARRAVMIQIHVAALLPLAAVLMARGVGYG